MQEEDLRLYLFVLVGRDGDKLGLFEGNVGNQTMARADAHDVKLRLVLMERVQHDLRTQRGACSDCLGLFRKKNNDTEVQNRSCTIISFYPLVTSCLT